MNELFYKHLELIKKDEHQWEAYQANEKTVVIAGPGSGKTRVLSLKAMKIMQADLPATAGLACISYSRETVREISNRLKSYGYFKKSKDYIGTVHGFCLGEIIGPFQKLYPEFKVPYPLRIAPNKLRRQIFLGVLQDLSKTENDISEISLEKERYISIIGSSRVIVDGDSSPLIRRASRMYEERLAVSGHIDFTQMAKISTRMIQEKEYVRKTLEARFPWLLIDEYQDLGKALHEMVLTLEATSDIKIFAVGDMDQSIYGFQGAYPDFLDEIYNHDDFKSIQLRNNYRSNQDMIQASIAALNPPPPQPQYIAKLRSSESAEFTFITCSAEMEEQFVCVAEKVIPKLLAESIPYKEIAVIVNANHEATALSAILKDRAIPFYLVRWNFDAKSDIIQWLMECCRWCLDAIEASFEPLYSYWYYLVEVHSNRRLYWDEMKVRLEFLNIIQDSKTRTLLKDWLIYFIGSLDLGGILENSERFPDEKENLEHLIDEAENKNLKGFNIKKFTNLGHPENEVTIITRHSVKGLEFEAVVLLGMEEGRFPYYAYQEGSREMAEAHRICYVCVSRAKSNCILLRSKKITIDTRKGPWTKDYSPSRFWNLLWEKFGTVENSFSSADY